MARLKLKRLLGPRKQLRLVLDSFLRLSNNRCWIEDAKGKPIYGEPEELDEVEDIKVEGELIGRIHCSQDLSDLLKIIEGFVRIESEKRELGLEMLDRYRELNLLYDLAEKLTDCHGISNIGDLVLSEANKVAPSDWGQVLVLEDGILTPIAQLGEKDSSVRCPLIANVQNHMHAELLEDQGSEEPFRSWVAAPVKSISGLIGLVVLGAKAPRAYDSGTLKLVTSLAGQCAPAIESTRLTDRQRALARSFARFVPDEFLSALGHETVTEVDTGEHTRQEMSVFFSDIRAFATLVEGKSPEESYQFINEYLLQMEPGIRDHQGFIAEVVGDSIMALFGQGGADNAVQAAIACQKALTRYNEGRVRKGEPKVLSGVGICSGELMLGTMGSSERIKCGVIGDAVNTASRVESLTKRYGTGILITHHTKDQLNDAEKFLMRPIDRIRVKGKKRPVVVYEILDGLNSEELELRLKARDDFVKGWELYQKGEPSEALVAFASAMNTDQQDRVARLYLGRCWQLLENGMPEHWDGIADLQSK